MSSEPTTAGSRMRYAEASLGWSAPSTRSEDEYLQRIWNLATDVIALEELLAKEIKEKNNAVEAFNVQCRRLDAIEEILSGPTDRFERE